MELGSVEAIKVLVRGGYGCSVLPTLTLGGTDAAEAVTRPLQPALSRGLGIVLRHEKTLDPALRILLDELTSRARDTIP